ncbi:MAG: S41 family peptidase [Bacteroidota bacterium]
MKKLLIVILLLTIGRLSAQQQVTFHLTELPELNTAKPGLRGSVPPLSWEKTVFLENTKDTWQQTIIFEATPDLLEYKFVLETPDGQVTWELDRQGNRLGIFTPTFLPGTEVWDKLPVYQAADLPLLDPAALTSDAKLLGEALWKLHPGIFRYHDSTSFYEALASLEQKFTKPHSYAEAYKEISRFTATLKCGHTYANPFNQTGVVKHVILDQPDKLPFGLQWLDRKLYITKNVAPDDELQRGTQILAINGMSIDQLADSLLILTRGDGDNHAKRFNDLNVAGYNTYEVFDVYMPLFLPPNEGFYELTVQQPGAVESHSIKVQALTRADRNRAIYKKFPDMPRRYDDTWSFKLLNPKTGYLKMGTFTIWNFEMDWKKFLDDAFKTLKKEEVLNLVIDIRGNEGGADEVLAVLNNYLLKEDCTQNAFEDRQRFNYLPEYLRPYISTWDKSVYDFRETTKSCGANFYMPIEGTLGVNKYPKGKKAYQGKVYLLVDAANSSATFYMAKAFRDCNVGQLVGETTGGSLKGLNGGNMLFFQLPETGIEVDIPIFGSFNEDAPARGIIPDIEVPTTYEGIKSGKDEQMEAVLELIARE